MLIAPATIKKELLKMSIYEENGYANRRDYLQSLAEEYGLSYKEVSTIADLLGPSEDFDGLISTLEDMR